jgi:hypothetical protein
MWMITHIKMKVMNSQEYSTQRHQSYDLKGVKKLHRRKYHRLDTYSFDNNSKNNLNSLMNLVESVRMNSGQNNLNNDSLIYILNWKFQKGRYSSNGGNLNDIIFKYNQMIDFQKMKSRLNNFEYLFILQKPMFWLNTNSKWSPRLWIKVKVRYKGQSYRQFFWENRISGNIF